MGWGQGWESHTEMIKVRDERGAWCQLLEVGGQWWARLGGQEGRAKEQWAAPPHGPSALPCPAPCVSRAHLALARSASTAAAGRGAGRWWRLKVAQRSTWHVLPAPRRVQQDGVPHLTTATGAVDLPTSPSSRGTLSDSEGEAGGWGAPTDSWCQCNDTTVAMMS